MNFSKKKIKVRGKDSSTSQDGITRTRLTFLPGTTKKEKKRKRTKYMKQWFSRHWTSDNKGQ